jgi:hypothetical protein
VELAQAKPERLGIGYFFVRGCAGMGRSFYALDVNQEARERIYLAAATLAAGSAFDFLAMWEGNYAQAHFELGRAAAMIREYEQAIDHLTTAVRLGWRDAPGLAADSVFLALEHRDDFRHLQDVVRKTEPLP